MEKFNNTRELLQAWPGLDDDVRAGLLSAISSRGKWQDFVLANAPAEGKRPVAYAAWQALMSELAPVRVSVGGIMFMRERELFDRMAAALDGNLGVCLRAQEPAFRWNLFAHTYNVDAIQEQAFSFCRTRSLELAGQARLFA